MAHWYCVTKCYLRPRHHCLSDPLARVICNCIRSTAGLDTHQDEDTAGLSEQISPAPQPQYTDNKLFFTVLQPGNERNVHNQIWSEEVMNFQNEFMDFTGKLTYRRVNATTDESVINVTNTFINRRVGVTNNAINNIKSNGNKNVENNFLNLEPSPHRHTLNMETKMVSQSNKVTSLNDIVIQNLNANAINRIKIINISERT